MRKQFEGYIPALHSAQNDCRKGDLVVIKSPIEGAYFTSPIAEVRSEEKILKYVGYRKGELKTSSEKLSE